MTSPSLPFHAVGSGATCGACVFLRTYFLALIHIYVGKVPEYVGTHVHTSDPVHPRSVVHIHMPTRTAGDN